MSVVYQSEYIRSVPCRCGAHRQHLIFRALWINPSIRPKDLAGLLKLKRENVREGLFELRHRNLTRLCPECFHEKLVAGVCESCGFEPDAPVLPLEVMADSQSPTNHLFPGNQLGSEPDFKGLGLLNNESVVRRWIDADVESPLVRAVKSDVENELKRLYPDEAISDEAGRLVIKEVVEFHARYPKLTTTKYARAQLTENVINRLKLLHPRLRTVRLLGDGHE